MTRRSLSGPRGLLVAVCCLALFLYAVYLGALSVLLPFIGASFRLGPAAEGRLFPANFLGFVGGVLACGYLSDRWGRKTVLLLGIGLYALGLALFGGAHSFGGALLSAALIGGGSGAMETVASALAADLYPERRAFIINLLQIAFGAGAALSPAIAHALLTAGTDWRVLYLGLAAADGVLLLFLTLQNVPRLPHAPESLQWPVLRAVLRQPAFVLLCASQAVYVGAETGFFSWMPTYFERRLPGGAAWAGLVVSVFWAAMTLGRIVTGGLVSRFPLTRLTLILSLGGAAGAALSLFWASPLVVLFFVACTGLCFSGIFGLILGEAGERYPQVSGTIFGAVVAAGGVGGAVLPWAVGALAGTDIDWRGALALIPLAAAFLAWLTHRLEASANPA
ncbi:MAG: MFS transporter [Armatimonadota bacterium]|nr:MFS transporter [Armatimonadota bacterium]